MSSAGCGDDEDAPWYYLGPYGDCECGLGYKGPFCTDGNYKILEKININFLCFTGRFYNCYPVYF